MRRINYKSDFDFILRVKTCSGEYVGWPGYDWTATFRTTTRANSFTASCIGGVCTNCYEDNGQIHIVCNSPRMGKGVLWVEFHAGIPDVIYPDGVRDTFVPQPLEIELVDGAGDCPTDIEVEISVPVVYLNAYDLAVKAGFEGTYEDYVGYASRFPQTVETSEAVMLLLGDFAEGKEKIADALEAQGVDASATESFDALAEKVKGLHLSVEDDPKAVSPRQFGGRQTLLEFMHNNRRAGFPGMVGVELYGMSDSLHGADAYLCSDGYGSTEGGEHEFADEHSTHYVIHYYAKEDYQVPTYDKCAGMIVLGGRPALPVFGASNMAYLHTYDCRPVMTGALFQSAAIKEAVLHGLEENIDTLIYNTSLLFRVELPDLRVARNKVIYAGAEEVALSLPALEEVDTSMSVFDQCNSKDIYMPRLKRVTRGNVFINSGGITKVCLPELQYANGYVVNACSNVRSIELPALETMSGGAIASNCAALTEIELPALETMSGGTIASNCAALTEIELPKVERLDGNNDTAIISGCTLPIEARLPMLTLMSGRMLLSNTNVSNIYMPKLEILGGWNAWGAFQWSDARYSTLIEELHLHMPVLSTHQGNMFRFDSELKGTIHVHLGNQQTDKPLSFNVCGAYAQTVKMVIHIEDGLRAPIRVDGVHTLTAENLCSIIANLGDNNGNATLTLTLGAANIAKLDEDTIALAQAKNYTIV